jgi:hypothetical protein
MRECRCAAEYGAAKTRGSAICMAAAVFDAASTRGSAICRATAGCRTWVTCSGGDYRI